MGEGARVTEGRGRARAASEGHEKRGKGIKVMVSRAV